MTGYIRADRNHGIPFENSRHYFIHFLQTLSSISFHIIASPSIAPDINSLSLPLHTITSNKNQ